MGALLLLVILIGGGLWLILRSKQRSSWRAPERQLERMLGASAAERLIRFEQERQPGLSRSRAAQRALERAEYDRGR